MIDSKRLLEQLLGASGTGGGAGGGLAEGLGGLLGGLGGSGSSVGGGLGGGLGGMVGQVTDYAKNNPGLSTVIAGGLASVLMGGGRGKVSPLTLGGIAGIGALAYKAYQQYKINNPDAPGAAVPPPAPSPSALPPPPANSPFSPDNATIGADAFALSLVSAMIAAAKSDGHIDDQERQKILGKLSEGGLTAEEQTFMDQELAGPLDLDKVVRAAKTPEEGIQIYAVSLLAITPDQPAERAYLEMLAARLGLDPALKTNIEQTVAAAATA